MPSPGTVEDRILRHVVGEDDVGEEGGRIGCTASAKGVSSARVDCTELVGVIDVLAGSLVVEAEKIASIPAFAVVSSTSTAGERPKASTTRSVFAPDCSFFRPVHET